MAFWRKSRERCTLNFMTTGDLARILKVHVNTIRHWAKIYAPYLSDTAVDRGGARRELSERDAIVLATVAQLRNEGLNHERVLEALDAGRLVDRLPDAPTAEEAAARERVALVPVAELHRALDRVQTIQAELDTVRADRDRGVIALEQANTRIAQLEREKALVEGELINIKAERQPAEFWLRVIIPLVIGVVIIALVAVVYLAGRGGGGG